MTRTYLISNVIVLTYGVNVEGLYSTVSLYVISNFIFCRKLTVVT